MQDLKVELGYTVRPCLKNKPNKTERNPKQKTDSVGNTLITSKVQKKEEISVGQKL